MAMPRSSWSRAGSGAPLREAVRAAGAAEAVRQHYEPSAASAEEAGSAYLLNFAARIASELFEKRNAALLPIALLRLRHAAKRTQGLGPRLLLRHAALAILFGGEIDMGSITSRLLSRKD